MPDIRIVTPDFAVAPQLDPSDMGQVAQRGFKLVINNRPDGEAPGQPSGAEMKQAVEAAGMDYVHIPVRGAPDADQVQAVRTGVEGASGPVLAFCRSGTRSIITWSIGQVESGASREDLIDLGREAGYDLSGVLG